MFGRRVDENRTRAQELKIAGDRPPIAGLIPERLSVIVVALALAFGVGVRVFRLESVPAGFHQDEACAGYDAYSLLRTGRDQHGNFLPVTMQAFDDYRRALFTYSLIPLIKVLGLKVGTVRLGAALWGISGLAAITALAGLMLGWPGAAAAAVFAAASPWHLSFSRFAQEGVTATATVSIAMLFFWLWRRSRRPIWLYLSAFGFGLSLYSYAPVDAFTPLFVAWLTLLYWREFREAGVQSLLAAAVFALVGLPLAASFLMHPERMNARFNAFSIFASCAGCAVAPVSARLVNFVAGMAGYFTPSFLFVVGDRGDHWTLLHQPGVGQLLPEQAPLIALALIAIVWGRRRRTALLLLGWTVLATLPAALILPLGASLVERGKALPTPWVLFDGTEPLAPFSPAVLLAHPDSRHAELALVPWILLSALGFAMLVELTWSRRALGITLCAALAAGTLFHAARFIRAYFVDYPVLAAPYFQYGMEQVVENIELSSDPLQRVVIGHATNSPYIYVLFFGHYPPEKFQSEKVIRETKLFGDVLAFDRYLFVPPGYAYARMRHGTFVFAAIEPVAAAPAISIRYPDGTVAYNIVSK